RGSGSPGAYWCHSSVVGDPTSEQMLATRSRNSFRSHSRTVWSALVVASSRPSGLNATPLTAPGWPVRGAQTGWRVAGSHSRTVASALVVANSRPSGLNATPLTAPVWPVSGAPTGWPVAGSHSRTVASALVVVVANSRPSGLNATAVT